MRRKQNFTETKTQQSSLEWEPMLMHVFVCVCVCVCVAVCVLLCVLGM